MTVTWRDGEAWLERDGAPMGVPFTLTIPSSTRPGREYRIAREHRGDGDGYLIHTPPCEAWQHGDRDCRHVAAACFMADHPREWFMREVGDLWLAAENLTEAGRAAFAFAVVRARQDAMCRLLALEDYRDAMAERERVAALRALMNEGELAEYDAGRAAEAIGAFA